MTLSTVDSINMYIYTVGDEKLQPPKMTSLHGVLNYMDNLIWGEKDDIAKRHLGAALEGIDEDIDVNVPSTDDDGEGGRK